MTKSKFPKNYTLDTREKLRRRHVTQARQELRYIDSMGIDYKLVLRHSTTCFSLGNPKATKLVTSVEGVFEILTFSDILISMLTVNRQTEKR